MERRHRRLSCVAALLLLTGYSAWVRWQILAASPYPLGVDGYFYPIQLRSLLEHGHLYYPTSPLAFWLMAPMAALTDPIVGAKLGASLGVAAVVWPAYALGVRLGGGRIAGLVAAVLATTSTGSLMLSTEFIKNGFGVSIGLIALWALLVAVEAPTPKRCAVAVAMLLAVMLTHKMATALVLLIGTPPLLQLGWQRLRGRRYWLPIAVASATIALTVLGLVAPSRFLSPSHLALGQHLFGGRWQWNAPALSIGTFELTLDGEAWKAGAMATFAAVALLGARWRRRSGAGSLAAAERTGAPRERGPGDAFAAWMLIALAVALAWPSLVVDDPQGLGFRLRVIAFVPWALTSAIAVGEAIAFARRYVGLRAARWSCAAVLCGLIVWLARAPVVLERGTVYAHPAMIEAVSALSLAVPPGQPVVVSDRHIAFMATWYARVITTVQPIADVSMPSWRLLSRAFIGTDSPLSRAIDAARRQPQVIAPRGMHRRHRDGLVLMPEATWQWILTQLPEQQRRYYQAWPAF